MAWVLVGSLIGERAVVFFTTDRARPGPLPRPCPPGGEHPHRYRLWRRSATAKLHAARLRRVQPPVVARRCDISFSHGPLRPHRAPLDPAHRQWRRQSSARWRCAARSPTSSGTTSGSPAPTWAASTASAAPAPCSWTAAARGAASSSPRRLDGARGHHDRGARAGREPEPAPAGLLRRARACSAASARPA